MFLKHELTSLPTKYVLALWSAIMIKHRIYFVLSGLTSQLIKQLQWMPSIQIPLQILHALQNHIRWKRPDQDLGDLDLLHLACDDTEDDLLCDLAWQQGQTDRCVIPQILLSAPIDEYHSC